MPRVGTGKAPGRRFARWTAVVGVVLIVAAPVAFWLTRGGTTTPTRVVGVVVGVVAAASIMVLKAAEWAGRMDRRWWPVGRWWLQSHL
jgi:hypothetical protein